MELKGLHYLGTSTSREGEPDFRGIHPENGEELEPSYADATEAEIDEAVRLAVEAHRELKDLGREGRARFLETVAEKIRGLGDPLLERAAAETALPLARLTSERGRTVGQLRMFADLVREGSYLDLRIDHAQPDRQPLPKPDVRQMRIALGPVAVFGASNFPLAFSVAGGDTASALAAGCPVVVKAHPNHPGTSEMVAAAVVAAVEECGLPAGTFSLVHGRSVVVGLRLVQHPAIKAVGFTGSFRGGKALFDAAAARPEPIPVFAEMGSINPVFLLPGVLSERPQAIAEGMAASVTLGVGQFCTNPGVMVAPSGAALEYFIAELGAALTKTPDGTMLHAGIRAGYDEGLARLQAVDGVENVTGMGTPSPPGCRAVAVLLNTAASTFLKQEALRDEVFGPSTLMVRCESRDEILAVAESLPGQLTATLHATDDDLEQYRDLVAILERKAGRLIVNGYPTGVEVCPSMHHGGPFPATTDPRFTSVGTAAITRFLRPVCYQGFPSSHLPEELRDENPGGLLRLVDGVWSRE